MATKLQRRGAFTRSKQLSTVRIALDVDQTFGTEGDSGLGGVKCSYTAKAVFRIGEHQQEEAPSLDDIKILIEKLDSQ